MTERDEASTPTWVGLSEGLGLAPERNEVERINALGRRHIDQMNLIGALELVAFARAVQAEERERIAAHFDERDRGPDGKPLGIGFYDPHEPAEIIRALGPNVGAKATTAAQMNDPERHNLSAAVGRP